MKHKHNELGVGDKMPDYEFINPLLNLKEHKTNLSDFTDKLVIIEIWSLGCTSCIAGFPKLQGLQEKFDDQLQILLVNPFGNRKEIESLFKRREKYTKFKLNLPVAFGDVELYNWFTVDGTINGVPHFIWIKDGEIISVTHTDEVNEQNIQAILNEESIRMKQKIIKKVELDTDKPIFVNGNGGDGKGILWTSMISGDVYELRSTAGVTKKGITILNRADFLIRSAYGYPDHPFKWGNYERLQKSKIKYELSDSTIGILDSAYLYQLTAPTEKSQKVLLDMMKKDMDRYFDFDFRWEKRTVPCLVLTAGDHRLLTNLTEIHYPPVSHRANEMIVNIVDASVPNFIYWLETNSFVYSDMPIIDETDFGGQITGIELNGINPKDWKDWNKHLEKYKLQFKIENREVEILIVRDR